LVLPSQFPPIDGRRIRYAEVRIDIEKVPVIENALAGLPLDGLVLGGAALFFAGLARGFAGFGLSAIIVATLTLYLPPKEVVPIALVLEVATSVLQARGVWHEIDFKMVGLMLAGAALGSIVGIELLSLLDPVYVRYAICGLVAVAALIFLTGVRLFPPLQWKGFLITGVFSGIANGLSALGGLVVAVALAGSQVAPAVMRASLIAYFFVLDSYALGLAARAGIVDQTLFIRSAIALPILVVGLIVGTYGFKRINPDRFRTFVHFMLVGLAILLFTRTVMG